MINHQFHKEVNIPVANVSLQGELIIPLKAKSIIVFAHGSGSSRLSKRNQMVASFLQERKFGTLLFDLLTEEEDKYYHNRFDINLLSNRLIGVTNWLADFPPTKALNIAYFGASTGAASALKAASEMPRIKAVVSRGGRPDLVMNDLHNVASPTILIVGSLDYDVLNLNNLAYHQLACEKKLEVIEGATHLFEEVGKMNIVSELAANWFKKYMS